MANTPKKSVMYNFRINNELWRAVQDAVKDAPKYFSVAEYLRQALTEKLIRETRSRK